MMITNKQTGFGIRNLLWRLNLNQLVLLASDILCNLSSNMTAVYMINILGRGRDCPRDPVYVTL